MERNSTTSLVQEVGALGLIMIAITTYLQQKSYTRSNKSVSLKLKNLLVEN